MCAELRVEIVYVSAGGVRFGRRLTLPSGARIEAALAASGLLSIHPEIDLSHGFGLAVFGRAAAVDTELADGDRVEVLRPLVVDPRGARRARAAVKRRRA
jgi:hypothetical protein